MFSAAIQGVIQNGIIVIIAVLMGVRFKTGVLGVLVIFLIAMMVAFVLGGISLALAAKIKTIETLMAAVNMLTMPLLFSINALFPTSVMPKWLQVIAKINPITYAINPMRSLTTTGWSISIIWNILIIFAVDVVVMLWTNRVFMSAVSE
jgi:ABC-2 type transport system permease protein